MPASLTLEERNQIEDQVWEQLIESQMLESEYERRGITVTTDEIVQAMRNSPPAEFRNIPEFQTDSQFDIAKYQRWLASSVGAQYLPALEAQYRDQIRRSKLLRVVAADIYLSDAALWEQYRDENEQVKIALTAIIPRNIIPDSAVKLTDAEVTAYYRSHQDDFKRPRTAYLSFVALPRLADASDTAAARARADSVRAAIAGGEPFADVARRESDDSVSAANGGDLGEWTRGSMDPAFDSAAFALPLNKVSAAGPVAVRLSHHRDHQPEGRQGQGPAHPDPDRGHRRRTATASTPRPTRSSGWARSGTIRRHSTPSRARSRCPWASPARCSRGPGCSSGTSSSPTPARGPFRARRRAAPAR